MEFSESSQSLYLSCNKVYRVSMTKWPLIEEKVYPHPMINVREIFIQDHQNIVVFVGYSTFKLIYLDRIVSYYEDEMLDKIIFHDNLTITANENAIAVFKYQVQKPTVVCQASN